MDFSTLLQTYGAPVALGIWGTFRLIEYFGARGKVEVEAATVNTKQDDTLTNFSIQFAKRNEELTKNNNELSEKYHNCAMAQARQEGALEQIQLFHDKDRAKWERAKVSDEQKIQSLESRLQELESGRARDTAEIQRLSAGLESSTAELALTLAKIAELETQNSDLATRLERETYRADGLDKLVIQIRNVDNKPDLDGTIALPDLSIVDDTIVPTVEIHKDGNNEQ